MVIRAALGGNRGFRIEHFGSTAVPGIPAKPIIDIMIIPPPGFDWAGFIDPLQRLGYLYWAQNPRTDRMFFVKGMPPTGVGRTHHIHVRTWADSLAELCFRDTLIADSDIAMHYVALKRMLAAAYPTDREAYTHGKDTFVKAVLRGEFLAESESREARGAVL